MTAKALAITVPVRLALLCGACAVAVGFLATADAQTVYKSVDDEGHVAYTDRPPEGLPVERVRGLDIERSDRARVRESNDEADKQRSAEDYAKDVREGQDAEESAINAAAQAERDANCNVANERLNKYSEARRLYRELPNGEREWLTEQEVDAARTKAALSVEKWCG